jgi:hypothetical protein
VQLPGKKTDALHSKKRIPLRGTNYVDSSPERDTYLVPTQNVIDPKKIKYFFCQSKVLYIYLQSNKEKFSTDGREITEKVALLLFTLTE